MKLKIAKDTVLEVPSFCQLPVVGELKGCAFLILANWEGNAYRVITKTQLPGKDNLLETAYKRHPGWFLPQDKDAFPVYGCDRYGKVIFGCVEYEGDPRSENPLERGRHFFVKKCDNVNGFNHYGEE
jgi:hypothetical protein